MRDPNDILHGSSSEDENEDEGDSPDYFDQHTADILFSPGKLSTIRIPHPLPAQIIRLWQQFVAAVNPLCKLLHEPTTYNAVLEATGDLTRIPKNFEALLFAIYALAAFTMEEEECEAIFNGEKKEAIVERYTFATRLAFQRVGLLRSADMMVVQAFVIHLVSRRGFTSRALLANACSFSFERASIPGFCGSTPGLPYD